MSTESSYEDIVKLENCLKNTPSDIIIKQILVYAKSSNEHLLQVNQILSPLMRSNSKIRSHSHEHIPFLSPQPEKHVLHAEDSIRVKEQEDIKRRTFPQKYNLNLPQSNNRKAVLSGKITDILNEPPLFAGFRNFLVKQYCDETLDFWRAVKHYRHAYPSLTVASSFQMALDIYKTYIAEDSSRQVNISAKHRIPLDRIFNDCQSSNDELLTLSRYSFDASQLEITSVLAAEWFPLFKSDDSFEDCYNKYMEIKNISFALNTPIKVPKFTPTLAFSDWQILFTNSSSFRYKSGEVIIEQNKINPFIFILELGTIRFERKGATEKFPIVLSRCKRSGHVFGEHCIFRTSFKSVLRIVADTDVTVRRLNTAFILKYIQSNIELAFKFFSVIAGNLTKFFDNSFESIKKSEIELIPLTPQKIMKPVHPLVEDFPDLNISTILYEMEIQIQITKGVVKSEGKGIVIITKTDIFVHANRIGQNIKKQISLSDITRYSISGFSVKLQSRNKKSIYLKFKNQTATSELYYILQALIELHMPRTDSRNNEKMIGGIIQTMPCITQDVWNILSSQPNMATTTTYSSGDVIIEQGNFYSMIAVAFRGSCRLEKLLENNKVAYLNIEELREDIFGETCFILGKPAPLSIVAVEDNVEVLLLNYNYIVSEFVELYPELATKFYFHLCRCISDRISKLYDALY